MTPRSERLLLGAASLVGLVVGFLAVIVWEAAR
jgi:hypothetical protein